MEYNRFMGEDTVVLDAILKKYELKSKPARSVSEMQNNYKRAFDVKKEARRALLTEKFLN